MIPSGFYNMDCMDAMRDMPDKAFELAIVDPPYGGGCNAAVGGRFAKYDNLDGGGAADWLQKPRSRFGGRFDKYDIKDARAGGTWAAKYGSKVKHWDVAPPKEYFAELGRVSKNQIIWGGNYFDLPPTRCFIVWRKSNIPLEGFTMSPCEYAWCSINTNAALFEYSSSGGSGRENRFHPTQKPVALYEWLLQNYATAGDKILDTHVGSASSLIACHRLGFEYWGFEIDADYYAAANERLEREKAQQNVFSLLPQKEKQIGLLEDT